MKTKSGKRHLPILIGITLAFFILATGCAGSTATPTAGPSAQPTAASGEATSAGQPKQAESATPATTAKLEAPAKAETTAKTEVAAKPATPPLLEQGPAQCPAPSQAFVDVMTDSLTVEGSAELKKAQALHIKMENTTADWYLVGAVINGQGVAKDTVGIWATSIDPTEEKLSPGMVNSINDAAKQYSEWPPRDDFNARFTAADPDIRTIEACVKSTN